MKEGVILLERDEPIQSANIHNYELNYERMEFKEDDVVLTVKKGMCFGIDGILIRRDDFKKMTTYTEQLHGYEENK